MKLKDMTNYQLSWAIQKKSGFAHNPYDLLTLSNMTVGPYLVESENYKCYALSAQFVNWANPSPFKVPGKTYDQAILRCHLLELTFTKDELVDLVLSKRAINFEDIEMGTWE